MIRAVRTDWFGRPEESVTGALWGERGLSPISDTMEQEDTQHRAGARQPEPAADRGEEAIAKSRVIKTR